MTREITVDGITSVEPFEFQGGGLSKNGQQWHVGHVPDRKQVALYWVEGNTATVAAWFPDEVIAQRFLDWLWDLT